MTARTTDTVKFGDLLASADNKEGENNETEHLINAASDDRAVNDTELEGISNDHSSSPSFADMTTMTTPTTETTELSVLDASRGIEEATNLISPASDGRAVNDAKLEDVVKSTRPDPFAHYECAFGFDADLSEPYDIPKTKGALCTTITEEVLAIIKVQGGLQSYSREINNGKHDLSKEFLETETKATTIAVSHLEEVKEHLKAVLREVEEAGHDDHDVHDDVRAAYGHAIPWIRRYRQILVHSHVFYKVNYVLCVGC